MRAPILSHDDVHIYHGDALDVLRELSTASCHALVTDPPAGIGFMGKEWDSFDAPGLMTRGTKEQRVGGYMGQTGRAHSHGVQAHLDARGSVANRAAFIAFITPIFRECIRVLKPGAHGLVWALPRTSHWTATALEDAGFEVRDVITHHFGSGFPKSLDVSKAIDKAAGIKREDKFEGSFERRAGPTGNKRCEVCGKWLVSGSPCQCPRPQDAAVSDAAKQWQGFGTALKPASEHWILVRAPLEKRTVAANVLAHETGALNIDECRIEAAGRPAIITDARDAMNTYGDGLNGSRQLGVTDLGRWPANLVLSHSADCIEIDGLETIPDWNCAPGCPIALLDRQSGEAGSFCSERKSPRATGNIWGNAEGAAPGEVVGFADVGGASRFFYCAKPSRDERNPEYSVNAHPTVKSIALMRWLCRLVTPPKGIVLDPFVGSGTTLLAAHEEGFGGIGIERDPESIATAQARMPRQHALF